MIHVVFNEPDLRPQAGPDCVLLIRDDFAVGPIAVAGDESGALKRRDWWRQVLAGGDYDGLADSGLVDDEAVIQDLETRLDANPMEKVLIRVAPHSHDHCGYLWLASRLVRFSGRIWMSSVQGVARSLQGSELMMAAEEWRRLCAEGGEVRILGEDLRLVQFGVDYFDRELVTLASREWRTGGQLIGDFLAGARHKTGDAFLLWRLKTLVIAGRLESSGELKRMRNFKVRTKFA